MEARDCATQLLMKLYQLEKPKTFEFAKGHLSRRELKEYLCKLDELGVLQEGHKKHLAELSARKKGQRERIRIKKRKSKKKKKKKDAIKRTHSTESIPEETVMTQQQLEV